MGVSLDWLDGTSAGRLLGISPGTLRSWARRGQVRSWRTSGGRYLYARADVLALLPRPVVTEDKARLPVTGTNSK